MQEDRLGLALSGGGFRASLFHLGVLRRLAELGLLQHVTQISAVSGGSIVAALYYLHFKRAFEAAEGVLTNDDYVQVVRRVEDELILGVEKDIRNRLLANPIAHLRELTSGNGFGQRMAQLYTRYFYRSVIAEIFRRVPAKLLKTYVSQGVPLHQLITRLPGQPDDWFANRSSGYPDLRKPELTLVDFNESEFANIPSLVINSTCLNTGGPFYFTLNEVGGPECGFVRTDEVFMLLQYKLLLESLGDDPVDPEFLDVMFDVALQWGDYLETSRPELPKTAFRRTTPDQPAAECFPPHTREHLSLYQAARRRHILGDDFTGESWVPPDYEFGADDLNIEALKQTQYWGAVRHLLGANFGVLRKAKIAAWTLMDRKGWPDDPNAKRGGLTRKQFEAQLIRALREVDGRVAHEFSFKGKVPEGLEKLIVDFYYFRSATVLHRRAHEALHRITLSQAVAASANFPPMFTPFKINELFEAKHFKAVYLTDGGVHDNQGIEWLLDAGCTHIIASDAGGLVSVEQNPAESRLPMMDRIIDVLMSGVRRVLLRSVRETLRVSDLLSRPINADLEKQAEMRHSTHLKMATVFHMSSHPRDAEVPESDLHELLHPFAPQLVAELRTDLDAFNELEIAALRHQGYQLADCYGRKMANLPQFRLPTAPPVPVSPVTLPPPPLGEHDIRVLSAGARRAARYSIAYPLHSALLATLIALIISLSSVYFNDLSSWHSIRGFTNIDLSDHLSSVGLKTPYEEIKSTSPWRAFILVREVMMETVSHTSILTVLFVAWALLLVGRELFRASDAGRKRVKLEIEKLIRRDVVGDRLTLLKRPTNLISAVAIVLACSTLHLKWLLAVVHLWVIPVALFFLFVHLVFTRLWLDTGRLRRSPGNSRAATAKTVGETLDRG